MVTFWRHMARETESEHRRQHPTQLFGYTVISRIGRGAGARIYAVREPVTRLTFAMKHVTRHKKRDIRYVEQIQNELAMGRLVRHEGIRRPVSIHIKRSLFRRVKEAALLVEYVEGTRFTDVTEMRVWETLLVFARLARAVGAMHASGILHCDLKPSNIMITGDRQPKLIDLGQACRIGTTKKRIQGTPGFMSPEQVHRKVMTVRTDVFGFGASLYWALTGRTIPTAAPSRRKKEFVIGSAIPAPMEINPIVPQAASELVMECIRQDEAKRPGSMNDIATRLEQIGREARQVYEARSQAPKGE